MKISELMSVVLPRLSGAATCSLFEAVREVQGVIVNRLLARQSILLVKGTDALLDFAASETGLPLPGDFLALAGRPYVAGKTPLAPLSGASSANLTTAGTPQYFDIAGRTLRLYPPPDSVLTVNVPYYYRPRILTALDDDLPFWGEFDSVFIEGCVAVSGMGLSMVASREFVGVIQSQVDAVLESKSLLDEQLLVDAINDGL